jgi:hypothetical protein
LPDEARKCCSLPGNGGGEVAFAGEGISDALEGMRGTSRGGNFLDTSFTGIVGTGAVLVRSGTKRGTVCGGCVVALLGGSDGLKLSPFLCGSGGGFFRAGRGGGGGGGGGGRLDTGCCCSLSSARRARTDGAPEESISSDIGVAAVLKLEFAVKYNAEFILRLGGEAQPHNISIHAVAWQAWIGETPLIWREQ